jgi:hypothetical protein
MFENSLIDGRSTAAAPKGPLTLFGVAVAVVLGIVMAEALTAILYLILHALIH